MEKVILQEFLQRYAAFVRTENLPAELTIPGVSIDSRTVGTGELFVAIRGERFDGHQFAAAARQAGAVAVVADEAGVEDLSGSDLPLVVVKDTLSFLMDFAGWYRSRFTIPVIGLTGSTGKTTVKEMLAAVLGRKLRVMKTCENMNNFIGVSLTLFQLDRQTGVAVVELGTNHPGEIARLTRMLQPTHAAVTNIGSGHIGYFGSQEAIFEEKRSLLDGVNSGGTIYLNKEDRFLREYRSVRARVKTFALAEEADYRAEYLGTDDLGRVRFRVNGGPDIRLQVPGRHHLLNALLAAAVGLDMGIPAEEVKAGLEIVPPVRQRMEMFTEQNVLFINDAYNANPESMRAAIDFLCDLPAKEGRQKFLVVGDMLELGEQSEAAHHRIGEYLADKPIQYVFCMGEFGRFIYRSLKESKKTQVQAQWFSSHEAAAAALQKQIRSGDVVLLKGSRGMAMEKVLIHLGIRR